MLRLEAAVSVQKMFILYLVVTAEFYYSFLFSFFLFFFLNNVYISHCCDIQPSQYIKPIQQKKQGET